MQKIVAIGGGDFRKHKTLAIDQEIVTLANKKEPKLLFIPTASSDNSDYAQAIEVHFTNLGCSVEHLMLIKNPPSADSIEAKILNADIIYVGGGNTLKMMRRWRFLGVDLLLERARQQGTVLCGLSAGSICWFKHGNSDSRKDKNPDADYIKVTALGFIDALHCPHYDSEGDRQESLNRMMRKHQGIAIALDDCAALQVIGNQYRIITSSENAGAYKIYWQHGILYKDVLEKNVFKTLDLLVSK